MYPLRPTKIRKLSYRGECFHAQNEHTSGR